MNALNILSSDHILSGMFMDLLLMCKDFDSKECTITPERRDKIMQTLGHFLTESLYHFTPNQLEYMKSSPYLEFYYSVMKQDEQSNVHNNCEECACDTDTSNTDTSNTDTSNTDTCECTHCD